MKQSLTGILLVFSFLLEAQPPLEKLDTEDIGSAIKMLGVEIFKYDFSKQESQYNLIVHIDEMVDGSITKSRSYKLGSWTSEQTNRELRIFSRIASDTASAYWIKVSHPNMESMERFEVPAEFRKIHFWKQIVPGEIEYDKKIPLLFYGMGWEAELKGRKVLRFCWGEDVMRDLSNQTLKKIRHMLLISYELVK